MNFSILSKMGTISFFFLKGFRVEVRLLAQCAPASRENAKESSFVEADKKLKRSIVKNVILIAVAFMVLFTSFQSMASLQSSINQANIFQRHFNIRKSGK